MAINMTDTATRLALKWSFTPTEELPGGWCSHVYADETRVLKCPWRGEELTSGYRAALDLSGWGGPEVLASDEDTGSILMARTRPGTTLNQSEFSEDQCSEVVAQLIERQKGRINSRPYLGLRDYFKLDHPLLTQLLKTSPDEEFLHGDLHHFNILLSEEGAWIPIDPKGLRGDPAYEPIAFMRNLIEDAEDLEGLMRARLNFFARRLNLDPWRMAAWGYIDQLDSGEDQHRGLVNVYGKMLGIPPTEAEIHPGAP